MGQEGILTMKNSLPWLNVLIIDDSPLIIECCLEIFYKQHDIKISQGVKSVAEGIKIIKANKAINMVFLDLNLPDIDGVQAISLLSECDYKGYLVILSCASSKIIKSVEQLIIKNGLNLLSSIQKPICSDAIKDLFSSLGNNKNSQSKFKQQTQLKTYEIIRAINNDELVVHYQPQVDILTRKMVGAEALCRLNHPTKGLIYPDLFIDKSEKSELIYHLTVAVLKQAAKDWKLWKKNGLDILLSVNISPSLFSKSEIFNDICTIFNNEDIPSSRVCIEITESILSNCEKNELEIISRLALNGFIISLDDFGTGHASIERLYSLPFTQIKIDKDVFSNIDFTNTATNLISSTSAMAKSLNIQLVVEGIETFLQLNIAKNSGCDVGQGYFISRPIPAENILSWEKYWSGKTS